MSNEPYPDDYSHEEPSSIATLLEAGAEVDTETEEYTGPCCEKCQSPLTAELVTICRRCGWYASLGTFVELDPNWEEQTGEGGDAAESTPRKSHVRVWLDLLPRWSWIILGSMLIVIAESVAARLTTPAGSAMRTTWSLSQLAAGLLLAAGCHIFNFLVVVAEDSEFGVLDLLLRPVKLWLRAAQNLPQRLWVTNSAICGVTAAIMSITVIGGLPYERLWDWGFQEPVKQNLTGAVMDRAKQLDSRGGADNLEEAIGDFAGSQDVDATDTPPKPAKPRDKADCVILGYQVDREGRLAVLFLGTSHRSRLIYAGRVTPKMPDEELRTLLTSLQAIKSMKAFIPVEGEGTWVQPKFTCRITYGERQRDGRLRDLEWERLMGTIDMPQ